LWGEDCRCLLEPRGITNNATMSWVVVVTNTAMGMVAGKNKGMGMLRRVASSLEAKRNITWMSATQNPNCGSSPLFYFCTPK